MVNVCENGTVIGIVEYNNNLDVWNGSNWQNGGTGRHLGISVIRNGDEKHYVLIHGTDWEGEFDYAEIVSDEEAFQAIMKFSPELLEEDKFKELNRFKENLFVDVD